MSYLGPFVIMLIVLSPVLIPALITAFHAAAGAEHSNAQIGDAALRSRPRDR